MQAPHAAPAPKPNSFSCASIFPKTLGEKKEARTKIAFFRVSFRCSSAEISKYRIYLVSGKTKNFKILNPFSLVRSTINQSEQLF